MAKKLPAFFHLSVSTSRLDRCTARNLGAAGRMPTEGLMRRVLIACAVLSLLLLPGFAAADTTFVSAALPTTSGVISLQPFNANHGTLDSVEVTITGVITAQVATQVNFDPVSGATIPVPFMVSAYQSFQG